MYLNQKRYVFLSQKKKRKFEENVCFSFKDINQEIEIKLEGKSVSPAPERRK
jgi:hypothetical protein